MENLIEIKDLRVEFASGKRVVHAVNGISLSLQKGETLGLVGETGAGKTTGGEILFEGEDLLQKSQQAMRHIRGNKISMIFQDPMTSLNPVFTVGDQISESLHLHTKLSNVESVQRAREMLEQVGIPGARYHEYPHQFSGGMKQRVVIAMALACNPELLIADEPTTALDVTIQAQVLALMNELKQKLNTSMLLITHDLGVVAEVCDRVAIMYAGEIVEMGSLRQIYKNTLHPYTEGLFGSLPSIAVKIDRLKPIRGLMPDPANLPAGCTFAPRCPYCQPQCTQADPVPRQVEPGHIVKCHRQKEA